MIFYLTTFKLTPNPKYKEDDIEDKSEHNIITRFIKKTNQCINNIALNGEFYCFVSHSTALMIYIAIGLWPNKTSLSEVIRKIQEAPTNGNAYKIGAVDSSDEITSKQYIHLQNDASHRGYFDRGTQLSEYDLKLDYYGNSDFKINEIMAETNNISKKDALKEAGLIMADKSLLDEIERIYSPKNSNKFYGHPVHYKISAGDRDSALVIIKLMTQMLHTRKRTLGARINLLSDLTDRAYDETDIKNIFKQSGGSVLIIDTTGNSDFTGNFASSYKRVISFIGDLVRQHSKYTLFFFIEDLSNPGFSKELIAKVSDDIDLVNINEGVGNREEAITYFKHIAQKTDFIDLVDDTIEEYLPKRKKVFKCYDVQTSYNKWTKQVLKNKVYSAYSNCKMTKIVEEKKGNAYEELQNMIGLSEVKGLIDSIIAAYKMQTYREKFGLDDKNSARHMVFTGNPGCAKTTVARLLADVLTEEGILKSGSFVECGRSDLVGQYVGWTAPTVIEKFKQADGGILFIDEAYSLVDERGLFGDEAINTIVQEMENRRGSVIVIFAGYPDKMQDFLDKNEGLRSRIAFHLDFADYKPNELLDIMKLMLKERGLSTDKEAEEKCLKIFEQAYQIKEYGNGRFVRNFVEKALLNQANRLMKKKSKSITKKQISKLIADDFDDEMLIGLCKKKENVIGFVG